MPQKPIPTHPSLDHFRHQARDLQNAQREGDPEANQRIREFHPRLYQASEPQIREARFTLADAQLTIALEYGFRSWAKLKTATERNDFVDPETPIQDRIDDPVFRRAVDLVDAGDEAGLRAWLAAHPGLARRRIFFPGGGYFAHPTLLGFVAENPIRHGVLPPNIVTITRILVEAGANPNDGTLGLVATGRVPRECGVQVSLIDFFVAQGVDPNRPMRGALVHGEFEAVAALLRQGAIIDLPVAAALGRFEDARWLLPKADADERHFALAQAAQHGRTEIVRLLLDAGEDPSRYNPLGAHAHSTPLHQAVWYGHLDTVRLLVARGARQDLKDTIFHGTPLGWAEHGGHTEIAEFLRRES